MNIFSLINRADDWLIDHVFQRIVNRIGGDYIGQRIAKQIFVTGCIISMFAALCDYLIPYFVAAICGAGLFTFMLLYLNDIQRASRDISRGFANPLRTQWTFLRIFFFLWFVLWVCIPPYRLLIKLSLSLNLIWSIAGYFASTENPPPKKVKQEETETMLNAKMANSEV